MLDVVDWKLTLSFGYVLFELPPPPWHVMEWKLTLQGIYGVSMQGLFQQFWEKAPGQNWEKMIDLTLKLGENNDIEHYKGSKIYPQNQVILDCIMPSIPL